MDKLIQKLADKNIILSELTEEDRIYMENAKDEDTHFIVENEEIIFIGNQNSIKKFVEENYDL